MFNTDQLLTFFEKPRTDRPAKASTQEDLPTVSTWTDIPPKDLELALKFQLNYIPGIEVAEVTDNNNFTIPATPSIPLNIVIAKCCLSVNDDNHSYYFYHDIIQEPTRYTMILKGWGILRRVNRRLVDPDSNKVHLISRDTPWTVIDKVVVEILSDSVLGPPDWLNSFRDLLSYNVGVLKYPLSYNVRDVKVVSNEVNNPTESVPLIVTAVVADVFIPGPDPVAIPSDFPVFMAHDAPVLMDQTSDSDESSVGSTYSPPYSPCSAPYGDSDVSDDEFDYCHTDGLDYSGLDE